MGFSRRRGVGSTSDPHRQPPPPASTHFFKVVLPSQPEENMLRIPPRFVNKLGSELSNVATLTTPSGFKQQIWLRREGKEIWFHRGWCEFAEHHSIKAGYFLVFNYRGSSCFQVSIFNLTACEIDYPCDYIDNSECDDDDDDNMEAESEGFRASQDTKNETARIFDGAAEIKQIPVDTDSGSDTFKAGDGLKETVIELNESHESDASMHMEMEQDANVGRTVTERSKKLNLGKQISCKQHNKLKSKKTKNQKENGKFTNPLSNNSIESLEVHDQKPAEIFRSQRLPGISGTNTNALRKAKMLGLKNPSFLTAITADNLSYGVINVPTKFSRRYLTRASDHIHIEDPKGRNWLVICYKVPKSSLRLGNGWRKISQVNNLNVGDVCLFELIDQQQETTPQLKLCRVR